jgi:YD repeat-containing protein
VLPLVISGVNMSRQWASKLGYGVCFVLKPSIQWLGAVLAVMCLWQATAASAATLSRVPVTMGLFSVETDLSATYTIPIQFVNGLVPGGGGLTPHIILAYSSHNGDGYLGYGWQLSGLSVITLCNDSVSDQFCLNRKPLIATSGAYGADGTVYHTSSETYAKIISHGIVHSGANSYPAYFTVQTKSGLIIELGNTADSNFVAHIWSVNKVSDLRGNYYTVSYTSDSSHRYPSLLLSQIAYGGNTVKNIAPNKTVTVSYSYLSCSTCSGPFVTISVPGSGTAYVISLSGNPLYPNGQTAPKARVTSVLIAGSSLEGRVDFSYEGYNVGSTNIIAGSSLEGRVDYTYEDYSVGSTNTDGTVIPAYKERMTSATQLTGATTTLRYSSSYPGSVVQVSESNGIGRTANTGYSATTSSTPSNYGVTQIVRTNPRTVVTTTSYCTSTGMERLRCSETQVSNGVTLKSITYTYAVNQLGTGLKSSWSANANARASTYATTLLSQTYETGNDLNGAPLPSTTTNYTYDNFGNETQIVTSLSDGASKTTTRSCTNDTTNWILGQLTDEQVQSTVGGSTLTRHTTYTHDPATGLVTQMVVQPGDPAHQLTTTYSYDAFGNTLSTMETDANANSRTVTAKYDSNGVYKTQACNEVNECTAYSGFGTQNTSTTDPNGLTATAQLDYFFRPWIDTQPDGTQLVTLCGNYGMNGFSGPSICDSTAVYNGPACPSGTVYAVMTIPRLASAGTFGPTQAPTGQNGPMEVTYYDMLGRVIATDKQGTSGAWIRQSRIYDAVGNIFQVSRPYFVSGGTPIWTTYTYDSIGRVATATAPDGGVTSYSYSGLTTSVTNAKGQITTTVKNAQGLVASVTDALGHTTSYAYDAFGNLTGVTDPSGISLRK